MKKILVLGASGMLGNSVFRVLSECDNYLTFGTVREFPPKKFYANELQEKIISGVDVSYLDKIMEVFIRIKPDVIINCIGLVKQLKSSHDPLASIPINSLLPHQLANIAAIAGSRLIHMSTDCVFSGSKGMYKEVDFADSDDIYGRSKYLGEVDYQNAITLRTSIIGHEIQGAKSLIDWFLSQEGTVRGFRKAIFSGLPTVEMANLIRDYVIPNNSLRGVYHVSADPISKYDLLNLVAKIYGKEIDIEPDDGFVIDRSLDSSKFRELTGYKPKKWHELIELMHNFR